MADKEKKKTIAIGGKVYNLEDFEERRYWTPAKKQEKFDPEGEGYDEKTAREAGAPNAPGSIDPKTGHWGSLDPRTGMVLKGRKHPTWNLMEEEEKRRGSKIIKKEDGRYYSVKDGELQKKLQKRKIGK